MKKIIISLLASAGISFAFAVDYTSTVVVSGESVVFNEGDTINVSGEYAIDVLDAGTASGSVDISVSGSDIIKITPPIGASPILNISNSTISGDRNLFDIKTSAGSPASNSSTTLYFDNNKIDLGGSVIQGNVVFETSAANSFNFYFRAGTKVSVGNGILADVTTVNGSVNVFLTGGSTMNGSMNGVATFHINDASTWYTSGSSSITWMYTSGAASTIDFALSSSTDSINVSTAIYGSLIFGLGLTEEFAADIFEGGTGEYMLNANETIVAAATYGTKTFLVKDHNDSYTWEVEDLGGNQYRLYNFQEVPEPSAYAALFGAGALALAWMRRRK